MRRRHPSEDLALMTLLYVTNVPDITIHAHLHCSLAVHAAKHTSLHIFCGLDDVQEWLSIKPAVVGHTHVSPICDPRHNGHFQAFAPSDLFVITSGASPRHANKVFSCSTMSLGDQIYGF